MAGKIIRITMFKIPSTDNQVKFLDLYRTMASTATKVLFPFPQSPLFSIIAAHSNLPRTANPISSLWQPDKPSRTNAAKATRSSLSPNSAV